MTVIVVTFLLSQAVVAVVTSSDAADIDKRSSVDVPETYIPADG